MRTKWRCIAVLALVALLGAGPVAATSVTVADQNSSLKYTIDDPVFNQGQPSDPMQLPRTVEWTVDGRRILVYPSGPSTFLDIGHLHADAHVGGTQIHAQGPMLGFATGPMTGTVLGGVVYTVSGGAAGAGKSLITEKVDIHNLTANAVTLSLAGFGFKPTQAALEVPDLAGLDVAGTTLVYYQGNAQTNSFTEPPFAPVTILPVVAFAGFNPLLGQNLSLPAGAHLTMITELKVAPAPFLLLPVWIWIVAALVLAPAAYWLVRRRRGQPAVRPVKA